MRLSTKTSIAIRALFDMAFHCRGQQAQARDIARRQRISVRTLEEVLQDLRKSGLIGAQRGRRGGYALARPAKDITVSEIVRALEGPVERLLPVEETAPAPRRGRPVRPRANRLIRLDGAALSVSRREAAAETATDVPALIWDDIAGRISATLEQTTLGDFVTRAESAGLKRAVVEPQMYFI